MNVLDELLEKMVKVTHDGDVVLLTAPLSAAAGKLTGRSIVVHGRGGEQAAEHVREFTRGLLTAVLTPDGPQHGKIRGRDVDDVIADLLNSGRLVVE